MKVFSKRTEQGKVHQTTNKNIENITKWNKFIDWHALEVFSNK